MIEEKNVELVDVNSDADSVDKDEKIES